VPFGVEASRIFKVGDRQHVGKSQWNKQEEIHRGICSMFALCSLKNLKFYQFRRFIVGCLSCL